MSTDMETTDWARELMLQLWARRLLPMGVGMPSINRRTAFHVYRSMGPQRSLAALARVLDGPGWEGKVGMAQLRGWSQAEDWPRACATWDAEQAATHERDELVDLESMFDKCMALMSCTLEDEDSHETDGEAMILLAKATFPIAERIGVVRANRAAQAQRTNADRRDLQEGDGRVQVPSYACGPHDDRSAPEPAQAARHEGEELSDSNDDQGIDDDGDDLVDDVWDDVEARDDDEDTDEPEDSLADMVGNYLDELPDKFRNALGPYDGNIRCIFVSKANGYVVLRVNTDKPQWITLETGVRCK